MAKTELDIAGLENVYDTLATAIDQAGPDKTELFLVKLALLNANALGDDALFASPIGLRGHYTCATVWAILPASKTFSETTVQTLRGQSPQLAWTTLHPRLLVGRLLADPLEQKFLLQNAWAVLRPIVLDLPAVAPRLWAT